MKNSNPQKSDYQMAFEKAQEKMNQTATGGPESPQSWQGQPPSPYGQPPYSQQGYYQHPTAFGHQVVPQQQMVFPQQPAPNQPFMQRQISPLSNEHHKRVEVAASEVIKSLVDPTLYSRINDSSKQFVECRLTTMLAHVLHNELNLLVGPNDTLKAGIVAMANDIEGKEPYTPFTVWLNEVGVSNVVELLAMNHESLVSDNIEVNVDFYKHLEKVIEKYGSRLPSVDYFKNLLSHIKKYTY